MTESERQARRRWINVGEIVAVCALIVSGLGVWISWKSSNSSNGPARVVEQRQAIPLTLRAAADSDGRQLVITPVEPGHALESLTLTIKGASPIEVGSEGRLAAGDVETALKARNEAKGPHSVPVRIAARYVEMGTDRRGGGNYVLRYRWEGGGLFGGRSIRLTGLSRA